jgi:VanZ family protein
MFLRIALVANFLLIAYLSVTPTDTITIGNDKISHFIAYAILTLNAAMIVYPNKRKTFFWAIITLAYGGILEVIQHYVPGRFMSLYDLFADGLGVVIGVILAFILGKSIKKMLIAAKLI